MYHDCGAVSSRPIEQLPQTTRSKLRSTQILTSLPQIVSELVQNSLDAGAHNVDIGVNCEEWSCWVRDDGAGISRDGLAVLEGGPGGGRYGTSKAYTPASLGEVTTFGFRGEALASAADLCCLEISSRTARSRECWSVILKDGKSLYNGPSIRWRRESPGTVVCVRDAFYNLPVRRFSHPTPARTIELIRKGIETLALVFPEVAFTLENTSKAGDGEARKGRVLAIPRTTSTLSSFRNLYGRALAEHMQEFDESWNDMRLQGFISLEGALSKAYQFLYVNRHLMATSDLHRLIDQRFSNSTFSKHSYDEAGEMSSRSESRRSPRKTEKKPVYVLNLLINPQQLDNCLEPAKSEVQLRDPGAASAFLSLVIDAFLIQHGFALPREAGKRAACSLSDSPQKRRRLYDDGQGHRSINRPSVTASSYQKDAAELLLARPWLNDEELDTRPGESETLWTDPVTGDRFLVDTITGNSRPLNTPTTHSSDTVSQPSGRRTLTRSLSTTEDMPEWISAALRDNEAYTPTESRIPELSVSSIFTMDVSSQQAQMGNTLPRRPSLWNHGRRLRGKDSSINLGSSSISRFQPEDLRQARVLGQVDRKFIACVMSAAPHGDEVMNSTVHGAEIDQGGRSQNSLVLIDQHAADERVRVERFLKELCLGFLGHSADANNTHQPLGASTVELTPPVPILLTLEETRKLLYSQEIKSAFARWGVNVVVPEEPPAEPSSTLDPGTSRGDSAYLQAFVKSIPEVLSDKLLAGDELRDVVKGYLAKLDVDGLPPVSHDALLATDASMDGANLLWQKALRWCPRELLELINSKACRGAIMFNDTLTLEQCIRLVKRLAETAFPFQCAHGRPSLVPLAHLDDGFEIQHSSSSPSGSRHHEPIDWVAFTK
ncbi:hypothetical protein CERSUDRAFT_130259 [Gelatoporia subvermispora B]|uniref:MutL C-terminal dimerisation domain-containing protein n=1 Tax=Ceriporiopsis subvermispora (strain B) TaxID=914234 RepID=M2PUM3_CERS8|nr:hypothetical protein CERSUDRAFT_130259 [Gelatoporia subvermispora B]